MPEPLRKPARFVWPPVRPKQANGPEPDAQTPAPGHDAGSTAGLRRGWRAVGAVWNESERVWLGLSSPPALERLRLADWHPDDASAYCWRCGQDVGEHEVDGSGCAACRRRRLPWTRALRLGRYEHELRDLILELKFHRLESHGRALGRLLADALALELDRVQIPRSRVVLVPVPMSRRRRASRGVDHTRVVTSSAARRLGVPAVRGLSRRHGPTQLTVPSSQRKSNVSRAFRRARPLPAGSLAVVIDDVRTTGATLSAACRALHTGWDGMREDRPELWVASVAVTPPSDRRSMRLGDSAEQQTRLGGGTGS